VQGDDGEIAKLTERMKSLLGPFVLRRLKQEVAGQLTTKSHATGEGGVAGRLWGLCAGPLSALLLADLLLCYCRCSLLPGPPPPLSTHALLLTSIPCQPAALPPPLDHHHRLPAAAEFIEMSEEQAGLYAASVAKMRSQITGKAAAAAADRSNKGVERFLRTLGAKKISHMFTHLRKIAQHPLLVRSNYTDDQVAAIAEIAFEK
jgi:hypothetical protein